jgi:hypothetical protein
MASSASYVGTPKVGATTLTTANTALNGTGTLGTVITSGTIGSRIDSIQIISTATSTDTVINLFIFNGTTANLWQQIPLPAKTLSTTVASSNVNISTNINIDFMPLILPTGHSLRAATSVTQTGIVVQAIGGDF